MNTVCRKMVVSRPGANGEPAGHRRLRRKLDSWAESLGFGTRPTERLRGVRPDVVRQDETGRYLFVGEAALADHEQPNTPGVRERLAACAAELSFLLETEEIQGGRFAVATASKKVATRWAHTMAEVMAQNGIADEAGSAPSFEVKQISPKTWVAYW